MYLIDPTELNRAIGTENANGNGSLKGETILAILLNLNDPLAASLGIKEFARNDWNDTFDVPKPLFLSDTYTRDIRFRLANGFVVGSSVIVTGPDGEVVTAPEMLIDEELGIITLPSYSIGRYTIAYTAGFATPADTEPPQAVVVFEDVPQFIKGAITAQFVLWARVNLLSQKILNTINFREAETALRRDIANRIYSRYQRPRANVAWPVNTVKVITL